MNFRVVAGLVARRASEFNQLLPVASRLADLIPPALKEFPTHRKANRWDPMLAKYYAGTSGLETVVTDFKKALQLATKWSARPGDLRTQREADHVTLASRALKAIEAGGAYCHLPEFVRQLVGATQPVGQTVKSLAEANMRYREIATRLATLKPDRDTF